MHAHRDIALAQRCSRDPRRHIALSRPGFPRQGGSRAGSNASAARRREPAKAQVTAVMTWTVPGVTITREASALSSSYPSARLWSTHP